LPIGRVLSLLAG